MGHSEDRHCRLDTQSRSPKVELVIAPVILHVIGIEFYSSKAG